jgi:hypothetical protein
VVVVRNQVDDWEDTSWGPWVDDDCFVVVRNSNHHCDEACVAVAREHDAEADGDDDAWDTASADTLATTTLACASCCLVHEAVEAGVHANRRKRA